MEVCNEGSRRPDVRVRFQFWFAAHSALPLAGRHDMAFNQLEMADGSKYRALVEFRQLVQLVDSALKAGGLLTLPMGIKALGNPVTINPQHIVAVIEGMH